MTHELYSTLYILFFDILSHSTFCHSTFCPIRHYFYSTFCPIWCYFYSTFCPIQHYVPFGPYYFRHYVCSAFCPIRHFVRSTFCIIRHFVIRQCVPFDVLSFGVLYFRRLLLRHFVGEPFKWHNQRCDKNWTMKEVSRLSMWDTNWYFYALTVCFCDKEKNHFNIQK
jgi:hypothetical protein